ncbi:MAG: DNA primase [Thermoprotei archaeon]|nr:MAG: DNA primase [Thermoprotei archaeon]
MGGQPVNAKYRIRASVEIDGIVEKSDVIGGIFGQTEGLLGDELDLRELQRTGRIGRIEVKLERKGRKIVGEIIIPSNLDRVETAIIAAAIEIVNKVGPYNAKVRVLDIRDVRTEKRKWIVERAKEILKKWSQEEAIESREIVEEVAKVLKIAQVVKYGPEQLPAGPCIDSSDTIIVVEGRADVINLLRHGYKNVIALEGATVPKTIINLSKKKNTIVFVDGDRGGEMIAKNIVTVADVDYIAVAPPNKEVEELTSKEIAKCLKNALPVEEFFEELRKKYREKMEVPVREIEIPEKVIASLHELRGTLEAIVYDKEWNEVRRIAVRDLAEYLEKCKEEVSYLVFDGIVTQRIVDLSVDKGIKIIVGARIGDMTKKVEGVAIVTFDELLSG